MEFPSRGVASTVAEDFCFFVDAEGGLSSGFLFFLIAAWACPSRKLCRAALVEVVAGSCTLGLSSAGGGVLQEGACCWMYFLRWAQVSWHCHLLCRAVGPTKV